MNIQQAGKEILEQHPGKFYIFGGPEYGIKDKYIQILKSTYSDYKEVDRVKSVLDLMNVRHLVPLQPALYVVRYDSSFIASLTAATKQMISSTNIIGTLVCIYESAKDEAKLSQYLDDYYVRIDSVDSRFMRSYLHSDFPQLSDNIIDLACKYSENYYQAQSICYAASMLESEELLRNSEDTISEMFGTSRAVSDTQIRQGIASRNPKYLLSLLEEYPTTSYDSIFYSILSVMLELEKIYSSKYVESDIRKYLNRWSLQDMYNMFMNTYEELYKLRTYTSNSYASLVYLIGLLQFSSIPDVEVMK